MTTNGTSEDDSIAGGKSPAQARSALGGVAVVALLASLCFAVGYWMYAARANNNRNLGLLVPEEALDFGEVWQDERFRWTLPIENPTGRAVEITDFITRPACPSIEPRKLLIPPGQTGHVTFTIDLSLLCRGQEKLVVRDRVLNVVPVIPDAIPGQRGWLIRGRARAAVLVDPYQVDYGDNLVDGQPFPTRTVQVRSTGFSRPAGAKPPEGGTTNGAKAPESANASAAAEIIPRYDAARLAVSLRKADRPGAYRLDITPRAALRPGAFESDILFEVAHSGGERIPPTRLRVKGVVKEAVEAIPPKLLCGACAVGQSVSETVVLRATGPKRFDVTAIETSSPATRVTPDGASGPDLKAYRVTQTAVAAEEQAASVTFHLRTETGRTRDIKVAVEYFGVRAPARIGAKPGEDSK
jgi:hypothetical protein